MRGEPHQERGLFEYPTSQEGGGHPASFTGHGDGFPGVRGFVLRAEMQQGVDIAAGNPTFQRFHERAGGGDENNPFQAQEFHRLQVVTAGRAEPPGVVFIIKVRGARYLHQLSFLRPEVHLLQLCVRGIAS